MTFFWHYKHLSIFGLKTESLLTCNFDGKFWQDLASSGKFWQVLKVPTWE
jgi:hypothetical protein